jgi:hypothetical protein
MVTYDPAEQEQPADIHVYGDRRDLRPDHGENAEDDHDHALGQEQSPVKTNCVPDGVLHIAERGI